jgi:alpha-beta hydrolase superfamily lysophospholipase
MADAMIAALVAVPTAFAMPDTAPPLLTRDGLPLHWRDWSLPAGVAARGTVLLVHGLGEHIGRYEHVARHLNDWGFAACGYDQRGHGQSPGARGALAMEDDLLHDLAAAIERARAQGGAGALDGKPLIVLGHSMGGAVAAHFCAGGLEQPPLAWWRPIDGLVLSSPALDAGISAAQRVALKLGQMLPSLPTANGLKPEWICRDPAVVAAYVADPLVHDRITPRLAKFIVEAGEPVIDRAARWAVPTLLIYAGSDRCVAPAGSDRFAAAAPQAVVRSRGFPVLAHEIFNEPEQDEVFDELRAWLDARFPGPGAAAG